MTKKPLLVAMKLSFSRLSKNGRMNSRKRVLEN